MMSRVLPKSRQRSTYSKDSFYEILYPWSLLFYVDTSLLYPNCSLNLEASIRTLLIVSLACFKIQKNDVTRMCLKARPV